ncbi:MAG: hypothetical protein KKD28_08115 [Chloroflexi bacterium]|nr:hypothetical protein [Chloroflexota bacterium]MBU1661424.1 hypothetical protein [Chloroflexota bacterium]
MNVMTKPLAEITQEAIGVLCREIGTVYTLSFVNQFTVGYGNYTEEREVLFGHLSMNEIIAEIEQSQQETDNS